jgi:arsenate reductase-like glutaredoxin family protein
MSAAGGTGPRVQVFGRRDSRETQKALRFFRERRVEVSFLDIDRRPPAAAELARFIQRLGARSLLDEGSRAFRDQGLGYLTMGDDEVAERLRQDPRLLRLPLIRLGEHVTVGPAESDWRRWLSGQ